MEVHNLFFNTPARRRFLKKGSTEFGHIAEQFSRIAIANPNLHLVLRHNDKLVYELPATVDALERIRRFLGSDVADHLIAVSSEAELPSGETIRLWGYVGEPSLNRSTRKDQFLFLNGRWIQDRSLQHALGEAYRGLLMVGRHAVSFLFLELPPAMVDVNVHPTKSDVRFQDSQVLYRQMLKTLRDKFMTLEFRSNIEVAGTARANASELRFDRPAALNKPAALNRPQQELDIWASQAAVSHPPQVGNFSRPTASVRSSTNDRAVFTNPDVIAALAVGTMEQEPALDTNKSNRPDTTYESHNSPASPNSPDQTAFPDTPAPSPTTAIAAEFRAFQIHDCYIVVAGDGGLEVIDQHALHERILYEHLRKRILSGGVERQRLLIPDTIECSATECVALLESLDLLKEIGFELQEFGGTTILLMSHPTLIPRGNLVRIV